MNKIKSFEEITCEELNEEVGCLNQLGIETTWICHGDLDDCKEAYHEYLSKKIKESPIEVWGSEDLANDLSDEEINKIWEGMDKRGDESLKSKRLTISIDPEDESIKRNDEHWMVEKLKGINKQEDEELTIPLPQVVESRRQRVLEDVRLGVPGAEEYYMDRYGPIPKEKVKVDRKIIFKLIFTLFGGIIIGIILTLVLGGI